MTTIKTAISIEEALFQQAEHVAQEMKLSRSSFFALAVEDFLRRRENQQIIERLNEVYGGEPDPEDQQLLQSMKHSYRRIAEREPDEW